LRAQIIGGGRVSEAQSRELYDLFQQFFVDEFNTLEAFAAELRKVTSKRSFALVMISDFVSL